MIAHTLDALFQAGLSRIIVVTNPETLAGGAWPADVQPVLQDPPLGTGDAVRQSLATISADTQHLLVVNGDVPLVTPETLRAAMTRHVEGNASLTLATCLRDDPAGYGRVLRDTNNSINAIVEDHDLAEGQHAYTETNEGVYCIEAVWAVAALSKLRPHSNKEYYLTDLAEMASSEGLTIEALHISDPQETMGVNDRVQLAEAESIIRQRVRTAVMRSGVTLHDPASIYIDAGVLIGQDTEIFPQTTISGSSVIGQDCRIGPHAVIQDSRIADGCTVGESTLEEATLEAAVTVGPYCHLRPGAYIQTEAHLGNYVEVKSSRVGRRTLIGHFSYIGDAVLGADVNVGAGSITCNFDGVEKHQTIIGDGVFLGSATMLVAPVTLGAGAATGAGAVVTKDVPPGELVAGVPARPLPRRTKPAETSR